MQNLLDYAFRALFFHNISCYNTPVGGVQTGPPRLFPQDKRQKGDHAMETIILGSTGIAATRSGLAPCPSSA